MAGFEMQGETDIQDAVDDSTVVHLLRDHDLRPTRQRVALAELLFSKGHRHISAEALHEEAEHQSIKVSLATIYNTLHQFTNAGLLRAVPVDGSKTYFDTNVDNHHHFFVEDDQRVIDIPAQNFSVGMLPEPPEGMEITSVEVVVRVRRKS
jgi:Fur family iron response transcriptional regulator